MPTCSPTSFLHRVLLPLSATSPVPFVLLHRHAKHYTLSIALLDAKSGQPVADPTPLKPKLVHPSHLLSFPASKLAFLDEGGFIKSVCLQQSGDLTKVFSFQGPSPFTSIESVHLEDDGYFIARRDAAASVLRIDENCRVSQAWDFNDQVRWLCSG